MSLIRVLCGTVAGSPAPNVPSSSDACASCSAAVWLADTSRAAANAGDVLEVFCIACGVADLDARGLPREYGLTTEQIDEVERVTRHHGLIDRLRADGLNIRNIDEDN